MKVNYLIALGYLGLVLSSYSYAGCGGSPRYYDTQRECFCRDEFKCNCTDPACYKGYNNCMSKRKCCAAFGNVGES